MAARSQAWYLNAMGVVRYQLRQPIATPVVDVDAERGRLDDKPVVNLNTLVGNKLNQAPAESLLSPSQNGRHIDEEIPQPRPKTATSPTPGKPLQTPPADPAYFRLGFWQPSLELAVLNAMPPGQLPTTGQLEMLANLLKAMGQLPNELPRVELIDWPVSPSAPADMAGARELMAVFLDVKAQLQPFKTLLLMGHVAASVVLKHPPMAVGDHRVLACTARAVVTHSLQEMEENPALKRGTWEAIRSLESQ